MTTTKQTRNWLISLALLIASPILTAEQDTAEATERADLRQQIEQARAEMAEAAGRMARLQRQLGAHASGIEVVHFRPDASAGGVEDVSIRFERDKVTLEGMPPRLGVLLGGSESDAANEIIGLTPGGGAEAAGLARGDRLLSVNGKTVSEGAPDSVRAALDGIEAGTSVPVVVERDGERLTFDVEAGSVVSDVRVFDLSSAAVAGDFEREIVIKRPDNPRREGPGMPPEPPFAARLPLFSALGYDSDLIGNHPGLAPYFGTADGVVVLRIDPENDFALRDGDVVLRIDDEAISRPVDLGRVLLGRDPGEQVVFEVMREGVLTQVQATMPDRSATFQRIPIREIRKIEFDSAPIAPDSPTPPQSLYY